MYVKNAKPEILKEFKRIKKVTVGTKFYGYLPKLSKENEAAAWLNIKKEATEALNKYPTTLEEDEKILEV